MRSAMPGFLPRCTLVTWVLMVLPIVMATPTLAADTETEIAHLLDFVAKSGCIFVRNDTEHDAPDARAHMERKYAATKRYINTAEDFIAYAATKSSMSGKPYQVRCNGKVEPSSEWLIDELARYRTERGEAAGRTSTPPR